MAIEQVASRGLLLRRYVPSGRFAGPTLKPLRFLMAGSGRESEGLRSPSRVRFGAMIVQANFNNLKGGIRKAGCLRTGGLLQLLSCCSWKKKKKRRSAAPKKSEGLEFLPQEVQSYWLTTGLSTYYNSAWVMEKYSYCKISNSGKLFFILLKFCLPGTTPLRPKNWTNLFG